MAPAGAAPFGHGSVSILRRALDGRANRITRARVVLDHEILCFGRGHGSPTAAAPIRATSVRSREEIEAGQTHLICDPIAAQSVSGSSRGRLWLKFIAELVGRSLQAMNARGLIAFFVGRGPFIDISLAPAEHPTDEGCQLSGRGKDRHIGALPGGEPTVICADSAVAVVRRGGGRSQRLAGFGAAFFSFALALWLTSCNGLPGRQPQVLDELLLAREAAQVGAMVSMVVRSTPAMPCSTWRMGSWPRRLMALAFSLFFTGGSGLRSACSHRHSAIWLRISRR